MIQLLLTVVGSDRPGLTQRLADAVLAAGGNWLESRLTRLGGKYVGAVLVEVDADAQAALAAEVQAIDAVGLSVTLLAPDAPPDVVGEPLLLEIVGQDRPGIVREFSAAVAALGVNIDEFSSTAETGAWQGERLFRANARLLVPANVGADAVRDAVERISADIMVDFTVTTAG